MIQAIRSFPLAHKIWLGGAILFYLLMWVSIVSVVRVNVRNSDSIASHVDIVIKDATGDTKAQAPTSPGPSAAQAQTPDSGAAQRPRVTIIMTGLGMSDIATERALLDLPPQVTLAFSPYSTNLPEWLKKSVSSKHENLILLPMESVDYPKDDAGAKALSSRLSDEENAANLEWVLKKAQGSLGVINFMGSRFLTSAKKLDPVFTALHDNNFLFVESAVTEFSQAQAAAAKANTRYLKAAFQIDTIALESDIRLQLVALERQAREKGYAVGLASPYPVTIATLKTWAATLDKDGIILLPLSAGMTIH